MHSKQIIICSNNLMFCPSCIYFYFSDYLVTLYLLYFLSFWPPCFLLCFADFPVTLYVLDFSDFHATLYLLCFAARTHSPKVNSNSIGHLAYKAYVNWIHSFHVLQVPTIFRLLLFYKICK